MGMTMSSAAAFVPQSSPSLAPFFGESPSAPLVGLLFSAAWCPDCQPVVPKLAKKLKEEQAQFASLCKIVYIPSETSKEQVTKFLDSSTAGDIGLFSVVDFDNVQERNDLKKYYKTCAQKEMPTVGITERTGGIPTLKVRGEKAHALLSPEIHLIDPCRYFFCNSLFTASGCQNGHCGLRRRHFWCRKTVSKWNAQEVAGFGELKHRRAW